MANSKPSKEEIARALGEEQLKGARQSGKDQTSTKDEKLDELNKMVEQGLQIPGQTVLIHVSRKRHLRSKYGFLGVIDYIDLPTFAQRGVMSIVQEYSGGGDYECTIDMPGVDKRTVRFEIEGDPQQPLPQRMQGPQLPGYTNPSSSLQQPPQIPHQPPQIPHQPPTGGFGGMTLNPHFQPPMNQFMGNPQMGVGSMNPYQLQQLQAMQPQKNDGVSDRVFGMLESLMQEIRDGSREDPDKLRLEKELEEMRRERERDREEQRRAEERRRDEERRREEERHREERQRLEMEQLRRDSQEMVKAIREDMAPKKSAALELAEALGPVLSPLLPKLLDRGAEQAQHMNQLFSNTVEGMRMASDTQAKTFEMMMNRPGPEDKMIKVSEAVSSSLATQVGLIGTLLQSTLAEKGDDSPGMRIAGQLIDTAGGIAEAMLGGSFEAGDEEAQTSMEGQQAGLERPAALRNGAGAHRLDAAQDRARRARAEIVGRRDTQESEPEEVEVSVPQISDFDTAMQTIFGLISQDGDPREIAFRLWKHAASGVRLARDWFMNPEEGSKIILGGLRSRDEITVSDGRIEEIAEAIRSFYDYLDEGNQPEQWLEDHGISVRMPRKIRRPVVTVNHNTEGQPQFGQHQESGAPIGEIHVSSPLEDDEPSSSGEEEEKRSGAGRRDEVDVADSAATIDITAEEEEPDGEADSETESETPRTP